MTIWQTLNRTCALAVPLVLVACFATTGNYEKVLQSWVGQDINRLLTEWGPPTQEYGMPNGKTMYTWLRIGGTVVTTNHDANSSTSTVERNWCKTTFVASQAGVLETWRWEGNSCRSR